MALPTLTGLFRLIEPPELRFSGNGNAVLKIRLAANASRKNEAGEWETTDQIFLNGVVFSRFAEALAEANLSKGQEVFVSGRLKTSQWETKEGEKRSAPEFIIDQLAPTIRPPRQQNSQQGQGQQQGYGNQGGGFGGNRQSGPPADDPWAQQGGGFAPSSSNPPF